MTSVFRWIFQRGRTSGANSPVVNVQGNAPVSISYGESPEAAERRHAELLEAIAREKGVAPAVLRPLFERLGQGNASDEEIRRRAEEAIAATLAQASLPVQPSNDGADIDATIGAARARLGKLDTEGADAILAEKIAEEEASRRHRLVRLLEEQASVQSLAYNHVAAEATLRKLLLLDPDRSWTWGALGDLFVKTGNLERALDAYRHAIEVNQNLAGKDAGNTEWQRDLSVSHSRIGDVQLAQGDLAAALASYKAGLGISERLAGKDAGNTGWQRDLSVSHDKIGDVQLAQGDLAAALASYEAGLGISERLAGKDAGNTGWQRGLAVSCGNVGLVAARQGARDVALEYFGRGREIIRRLIRISPDLAVLRNDLALFDQQIAKLGGTP